ncbi:MAG: universal stress protein [Gemmatimonadota bacterium]
MSGHVLTPLDGSRFGEAALPFASAISDKTGWELHLLHVHIPDPRYRKVLPAVPPAGFRHGPYRSDWALRAREAYLEGTVERHGLRVGSMTALRAEREGVSSTIRRHAEALQSDLIVMSTHGRTGVERFWLGSVADALARATAVPVFLVRTTSEGISGPQVSRVHQVLVPLDASPVGEKILDPVLRLAPSLGWRVRLFHVVPTRILFGARSYPLLAGDIVERHGRAVEYLRGVATRFRERDVPVEIEVVEGDQPSRIIVDAAREWEADLVAMASHGRGGLTRAILGSVTDRVLSRSSLPLLVGGGGMVH